MKLKKPTYMIKIPTLLKYSSELSLDGSNEPPFGGAVLNFFNVVGLFSQNCTRVDY
jgi:hypothetical protein